MIWPSRRRRVGSDRVPCKSRRIGCGMETLESRTVLSATGVLPVALQNVDAEAAVLFIDVSESMGDFQNLDVNRDGVLNELDDVNHDDAKGTSLDLAIQAAIDTIASGDLPNYMSIIIFGADAKALDMALEGGYQSIGPTYEDTNLNGVPDTIDALRTLRVGGGGLFAQTNVNPNQSFFSSPLAVLVEMTDAFPNITFRMTRSAAGTTLPVTDPDPGFGTVIDNDVSPSSVGYFSMDVDDGGTSTVARVTAQGITDPFVNTNFLFEFLNYVDVGSDGSAESLANTTITSPAARDPSGEDIVTSSGTFAGNNGTIQWTATTSIADGSGQIVNSVTFSSLAPLGNLQFINYLDEDIQNFSDDILAARGVPGQANFEAFTLDGPQRVGFSQSGVYSPDGSRLVNATYDGWAADGYPLLQFDIEGAGTTYSPPGNINTTTLTPFVDPSLGLVYGPEDITTAFSWTVNPSATTATITTFLTLIPENPSTTSGVIFTDGAGLLPSSNDILDALRVRSLTINTTLVGHYFEVGPLSSVDRIATATNGTILVKANPVIVDHALIAPIVPTSLSGSPDVVVESLAASIALAQTSLIPETLPEPTHDPELPPPAEESETTDPIELDPPAEIELPLLADEASAPVEEIDEVEEGETGEVGLDLLDADTDETVEPITVDSPVLEV